MIEFASASELEKFIVNHEYLEPGDKLEGKILEIRPNGKALIDFGGFRALASIKFPIKVGETLAVTVESKGRQLKFRMEAAAAEPRIVDVKV